ncbi:MAG: CopG family transcriptional regulator [Thermoproteales archaeon]|nr:CopG family transcriptional regulator [Thermoproteales archaeon]RLE65707.1 MAG: transcriptional regulator [Thermoprotei archaeon]
MRLITVHLPIAYINALRSLVRIGLYPNVSEAIRVAIRDFIHKEMSRVNESYSGISRGRNDLFLS